VTAAAVPPQAEIRVLHCEGNTDGTIGGSYFSLLFLIQGLKGTRYRPFVVFHRANPLQPRFTEAGADVLVLEKRPPIRFRAVDSAFRRRHPVVAVPVVLLQRALNFARFLATVLQFARLLRTQRIGLLHLNNSVTGSHEWMLAALVTRTPYVVHERGINERFSFLARLLAPRASAVICISQAVRANLVEHRVALDNLRVIENGLDPAEVAPRSAPEDVRRSLGIDERSRVIGIVGNIKEWKGQEVVVRALPAILARVPPVVCVFVGSASEPDRAYEASLRDLISHLGLDAHVIFTGYREHVADFLNVMEVPIHASILPEPFGRVLLEAMALRKPVVGSRAGAVPEIIEYGVTGYTFAPRDSDELSSHVIDLLERPSAARAFGEAGYARLLERFSITANVSRTLRLYDELLAMPECPR